MLKFLLAFYLSSVIVSFFVLLDISFRSIREVKHNLFNKYKGNEKEVEFFLSSIRSISKLSTFVSSFFTSFIPVANSLVIITYAMDNNKYVEMMSDKLYESINDNLISFLATVKKAKEVNNNGD